MRVLLAVAVTLVLAACGGRPDAERDRDDVAAALAAVRQSNVRAYYAGDAVAGLPLTHVERGRDRPLFVYGECNGEGAGDAFHCRGPQVQIENWPLARRHPSMFQLTPTDPAPCERTTVRNVPAAIFTTSGGALEVYAGDVVVVIFGRRAHADAAAAGLRLVGSNTVGRLTRPPADVDRALARCAIDPPAEKVRELLRDATARVYWVGHSFGGHPLARVEGEGEYARFVYGACARTEAYSRSEASCFPPLEIRVEPVSDHMPGAYASSIDCTRDEQRGVPVATLPDAHTLHVFTGERTIELIGPDLTLLYSAIDALHALDRAAEPEAALAPPARMVLRSLAERCAGS